MSFSDQELNKLLVDINMGHWQPQAENVLTEHRALRDRVEELEEALLNVREDVERLQSMKTLPTAAQYALRCASGHARAALTGSESP